MKEGDILVCKKSVKFFKKGNYYVIGEAHLSNNILVKEISGDYVNDWWFNIKCSYSNSLIIDDYFHTLAVLRKLKLEELDKLWGTKL